MLTAIGVILATTLAGSSTRSGDIKLVRGTVTEIEQCFVETHFTCEGQRPLVALSVNCDGDNELGLGMGVRGGDCFRIRDAIYCVDAVSSTGALLQKRYDVTDDVPPTGSRPC
ncbi:MAG: hypothetical protein R3B13_21485 [Polyangiaceae bacterium]